jgi:hypothetical protein
LVDSNVPYYDLPDGPILNDTAFQEEFGNVLANDAIPEVDFTPDAYDQDGNCTTTWRRW